MLGAQMQNIANNTCILLTLIALKDMDMLNVFEKDVEKVPQTVSYRLNNGTVTIADQDECLKYPRLAMMFAGRVKGADIARCQESACKDPFEAFQFARYIKGADKEY